MRYKNTVLRIAGFLAGLLVLLLVLNTVFSPKKWYPEGYIQDRNARTAMLSCEEPETIDIINVGDSESGMDFNPMTIWETKGYTSLNIGCDGLTLPECYTVLKKMFRTQSPRVVLVESNLLYRSEKKRLAKSMTAEFFYDAFEGLRFHNVWKYVWKERGYRLYFKGCILNGFSNPYEGETDYMKPTEEAEDIQATPAFWLNKICSLCRKHGAEPVLWSAPSPINYHMAKHNALQYLADKNEIRYLDCNLSVDEIGLDWSKDTLDKGDHLNCFGAEKTTAWLTKRIEEDAELSDHRGEASYARAWDPVLERYLEMKDMMKGYHSENLPDEVKDYIYNGGDFREPGF